MKRLIVSAAFLMFFGSIASAQTSTGGSGSRTTGAVSSTGSEAGSAKKGAKSKKATAKKSVDMNQRREYKSKNGQTATPTGHDATGVGETNAALGKDSTRKKEGNQ